ncbi:hypothetical protein [Otariodibacter oris]|uniref:Uncharacterized protein n=1 Tax=Otariodibacter oris TaxID=1032623 RepID=A0A420XF23_9PAST|nr:hypothetical protein [Otariodibacter oris]QGM81527.1 hypothetical protein A6A10_08960 [Otariodibacter oris]RKR71135.1 hypothetical protein DES31_1714 [Otariodibacter oris]
MKFLKSLLVLSLSTLLATTYTYAADESNSTQAQQITNQSLQNFTQSIELRFSGVSITGPEEQQAINFTYYLKNISQKEIKEIEWVTILLTNNQVLTINEPLVFEDNLLAVGQEITVELPINFTSLPEEVKTGLLNSNIQAQFQAKKIVFSDNSEIIVE